MKSHRLSIFIRKKIVKARKSWEKSLLWTWHHESCLLSLLVGQSLLMCDCDMGPWGVAPLLHAFLSSQTRPDLWLCLFLVTGRWLVRSCSDLLKKNIAFSWSSSETEPVRTSGSTHGWDYPNLTLFLFFFFCRFIRVFHLQGRRAESQRPPQELLRLQDTAGPPLLRVNVDPESRRHLFPCFLLRIFPNFFPSFFSFMRCGGRHGGKCAGSALTKRVCHVPAAHWDKKSAFAFKETRNLSNRNSN